MLQKCYINSTEMLNVKLKVKICLKIFLRWAGPRPHIPFPHDLILYVNLVTMGPVHLSPVTWPQALLYWYSLTLLMHIVAQLRPMDLHNFLGQIP